MTVALLQIDAVAISVDQLDHEISTVLPMNLVVLIKAEVEFLFAISELNGINRSPSSLRIWTIIPSSILKSLTRD